MFIHWANYDLAQLHRTLPSSNKNTARSTGRNTAIPIINLDSNSTDNSPAKISAAHAEPILRQDCFLHAQISLLEKQERRVVQKYMIYQPNSSIPPRNLSPTRNRSPRRTLSNIPTQISAAKHILTRKVDERDPTRTKPDLRSNVHPNRLFKEQQRPSSPSSSPATAAAAQKHPNFSVEETPRSSRKIITTLHNAEKGRRRSSVLRNHPLSILLQAEVQTEVDAEFQRALQQRLVQKLAEEEMHKQRRAEEKEQQEENQSYEEDFEQQEPQEPDEQQAQRDTAQNSTESKEQEPEKPAQRNNKNEALSAPAQLLNDEELNDKEFEFETEKPLAAAEEETKQAEPVSAAAAEEKAETTSIAPEIASTEPGSPTERREKEEQRDEASAQPPQQSSQAIQPKEKKPADDDKKPVAIADEAGESEAIPSIEKGIDSLRNSAKNQGKSNPSSALNSQKRAKSKESLQEKPTQNSQNKADLPAAEHCQQEAEELILAAPAAVDPVKSLSKKGKGQVPRPPIADEKAPEKAPVVQRTKSLSKKGNEIQTPNPSHPAQQSSSAVNPTTQNENNKAAENCSVMDAANSSTKQEQSTGNGEPPNRQAQAHVVPSPPDASLREPVKSVSNQSTAEFPSNSSHNSNSSDQSSTAIQTPAIITDKAKEISTQQAVSPAAAAPSASSAPAPQPLSSASQQRSITIIQGGLSNLSILSTEPASQPPLQVKSSEPQSVAASRAEKMILSKKLLAEKNKSSRPTSPERHNSELISVNSPISPRSQTSNNNNNINDNDTNNTDNSRPQSPNLPSTQSNFNFSDSRPTSPSRDSNEPPEQQIGAVSASAEVHRTTTDSNLEAQTKSKRNKKDKNKNNNNGNGTSKPVIDPNLASAHSGKFKFVLSNPSSAISSPITSPLASPRSIDRADPADLPNILDNYDDFALKQLNRTELINIFNHYDVQEKEYLKYKSPGLLALAQHCLHRIVAILRAEIKAKHGAKITEKQLEQAVNKDKEFIFPIDSMAQEALKKKGKLSAQELQEVYLQSMGRYLLVKLDSNKDKKISSEEFVMGFSKVASNLFTVQSGEALSCSIM
jgi:hypothetical protein